MKKKVTDSVMRGLRPRERMYEIRDSALLGFVVRVLPGGAISYYINPARGVYRKIGSYPLDTASLARARALDGLQTYARTGSTKHRRSPANFKSFVANHYRPHYELHHASLKGLAKLRSFGFDSLRLDEITVDRVERRQAERLRKGTSRATVNRDLNALRAAVTFAVNEGFLTVNPLSGLKRLPDADHPRVRFLTTDERTRLMAALSKAPAYLRVAIVLTLATGARHGELFTRLQWSDVKLEPASVRLWTLKGNKRRDRRIPLNPRAQKALEEWAFIADPGDKVMPVTDHRKPWAGVLKRARIADLSWHDLRHDFASQLVQRGASLAEVGALLGHSDPRMTQRYAHLSPAGLQAAVNLLDQPAGL